jgi:chromosome partitioning protein
LDADSHNIELSIEEDAGATKYMSEWLEKVKGEYDYVIIDSAPGSGAMLVNVIVAADELIIPIADKFSIPGAKKLTQIIRANNKEVRGHYLLTKQTKWGVSKQIKELLLTQAPENLYHTAIRQCEELNKAAACGMSIFDYNPKCNGAEDYMALAKEINKGTKDKDMPF